MFIFLLNLNPTCEQGKCTIVLHAIPSFLVPQSLCSHIGLQFVLVTLQKDYNEQERKRARESEWSIRSLFLVFEFYIVFQLNKTLSSSHSHFISFMHTLSHPQLNFGADYFYQFCFCFCFKRRSTKLLFF